MCPEPWSRWHVETYNRPTQLAGSGLDRVECCFHPGNVQAEKYQRNAEYSLIVDQVSRIHSYLSSAVFVLPCFFGFSQLFVWVHLGIPLLDWGLVSFCSYIRMWYSALYILGRIHRDFRPILPSNLCPWTGVDTVEKFRCVQNFWTLCIVNVVFL